MAKQTMDQVYANVVDYGAPTNGDDASSFIQAAIESGRHVLFPAGTYTLGTGDRNLPSSGIIFGHDYQQVTFLAGAVLQPHGDRGEIRINGKYQVIKGMRVIPNPEPSEGPIVDIEGADGLRLEEMYVGSSAACTRVRVRNLTRCELWDCEIRGTEDDDGDFLGVGLEIGEGAHEVGAYSTSIVQCGLVVLVSGQVRGPSFVGCDFEQCTGTMMQIAGTAQGFVLDACHFEARYGGRVHIEVPAGGAILGGSITGCHLGEFMDSTDTDGRRRVFDIAGTVQGLSVTGCTHLFPGFQDDPYKDNFVWELADDASVFNVADEGNYWDMKAPSQRFKARSTGVAVIDNTNSDGTLWLAADAVRLDTDQLGFFSSAPATRGAAFRSSMATTRTASGAGHEAALLAGLLKDLAALGLIQLKAG